jgi:hypothetical protein
LALAGTSLVTGVISLPSQAGSAPATATKATKDFTQPGTDGKLSITVSPNNTIVKRSAASDPGFALTINDPVAGSPAYKLNGIPTGWTVTVGSVGGPAVASAPDLDGDLQVTLTNAQASQEIDILPPVGYTGTAPHVVVSRMTSNLADNAVTAFDGGTFDYIGTANPRIPTGDNNPETGDTGYAYQPPPLWPSDGYYTIVPSTYLSGWNWRDIRSHTNPGNFRIVGGPAWWNGGHGPDGCVDGFYIPPDVARPD